MFCVSQQFLYIRLTVPEEKNNNDDRHIKKRQNKSYCQFFFFLFSLSLSVSLSPFQSGSTQKKTEAKKKKEATNHRPTSLSATSPYAKLSPSCFAIRSLTYILYIISAASSLLSSKFYYFNSLLLYFLSILY
jgi:hypothetical protein